MTHEAQRLEEAREQRVPWRKWGPYLSERQWGTVREDYSSDGNAWCHFTHDQARSRAYRWGEDGIGGISDEQQHLCFALALWNGNDPILKERMFGLANAEGNHGEDVKEYYFYLDSTPTHSYMKFLYKYPHAAYPYDDLVRTNAKRSRQEQEYELIDTGVFKDNRYFDVFIEYAKQSADDVLIQITVVNRGPDEASIHLLPTLWFRNTWALTTGDTKPRVREVQPGDVGFKVIAATHDQLGLYHLYCDGNPSLLFTENETNQQRVFRSQKNPTPYVKDAFDDYLVHGQASAVNPEKTGTKSAVLYTLRVGGEMSQTIRLRLTASSPQQAPRAGIDPFGQFDAVMDQRRKEADEFYLSITPPTLSGDGANVMRQGLAGMLWSKQFYYYDLRAWIRQHFPGPGETEVRGGRNGNWFHMLNSNVISMPDKWEYPWYAAWDLAFHCVALAMVDPDFAKDQLKLMLSEHYLHPNGQIPAYEWNFGDVNPPVHAWATYYIYCIEKSARGKGDLPFLKSAFQKLLLNFTWWVNRKDRTGRNVFEGGFLGLDNIGVFDRSAPLPTGGCLEQADGTAWMAFFSQSMLEIAIELAMHDPTYEDLAMKFIEHFLWIAAAMDRIGLHEDEMWDEADGFFYDVLRLPDGTAMRLKVRSMVGLLPLCATTVITQEQIEKLPRVAERARAFLARHPDLISTIAPPNKPGAGGRRLLSLLDEPKLRRVLARLLDEKEFLSDFGIRALSRCHAEQPYVFAHGGERFEVHYAPAESSSGMFGGNSNWRGPIWMPVNVLIVRALLKLYAYYGDEFTIECPAGSGKQMNLFQAAREITRRLCLIFLRGTGGRRPLYGGAEIFQKDPHWRDNILFYEYFHGDNGAGLGASHQTGWTGTIALALRFFEAEREDTVLGGVITARAYVRKETVVQR